MGSSEQVLVDRIESYYAAVDRFDSDAIVAHFAPDATMTVATGDVSHKGHAAIRATYDRRAQEVDSSFHGNFVHVVDGDAGRAVTRLDVHRITQAGTLEMDCIAIFTFAGDLIQDIVIWMSGENSLK